MTPGNRGVETPARHENPAAAHRRLAAAAGLVVGPGRDGRRLPALSGSDRRARPFTVARHRAESRAQRLAVRGGEAAGAPEPSVDSNDVSLLDVVSRRAARAGLSAPLGNR